MVCEASIVERILGGSVREDLEPYLQGCSREMFEEFIGSVPSRPAFEALLHETDRVLMPRSCVCDHHFAALIPKCFMTHAFRAPKETPMHL